MPYEKQKALSAETQEVFPKRRGDIEQGKRRMIYFDARMAGYSKADARQMALQG
jgi:hypothetical protein